MTREEEAQVWEDYMNEYRKVVMDLAKELDISEGCAESVIYLRGRSRWTPEK